MGSPGGFGLTPCHIQAGEDLLDGVGILDTGDDSGRLELDSVLTFSAGNTPAHAGEDLQSPPIGESGGAHRFPRLKDMRLARSGKALHCTDRGGSAQVSIGRLGRSRTLQAALGPKRAVAG